MHHLPGKALNRSTIYRRKKKEPSVGGRGRKRVCPVVEDASLGLAAGILEEIEKSGRCELSKLTQVPLADSQEFFVGAILDVRPDAETSSETARNATVKSFSDAERDKWALRLAERIESAHFELGKARMLRGSDERIEKLRSWNLPAKNILYAVALLLLEGIGERRITKGDTVVRQRGSRKNSEFFAEEEATRAEKFPDSPGRTRAFTAVCNVHEFRTLGLDPKMCSYLRKHKKTREAIKRIGQSLGGVVPLDTAPALDGAVLVLPKLTRDVMAKLGR